MFMLGFAYQRGGLPVSAEAIEKAIELNGEAAAMNVAAFRWGRRAAHEPAFVKTGSGRTGEQAECPHGGDAGRCRRTSARRFLSAYQNAAYARRFTDRIERLRAPSMRLPEARRR
jgi:indolepyruvate ferredoxin oxidoreductase